ncbi:unnamed protein product [Psylliodes chrysocephalus]|uniref:HAT C-terminal dimerisation domain-containing protein n=1 Tax=Psylliodes chrysocephalus TaxID=3402493 RepID=A0A9P0D497_9CUCU|nr:unnamed protein product [Psylliodes chrysocephala]
MNQEMSQVKKTLFLLQDSDEDTTMMNSSDDEDDSDVTCLHNGDYCVVKVCGKTPQSFRLYVAKVLKKIKDSYDVIFCKRQNQLWKFTETTEEAFILALKSQLSVVYEITEISDKKTPINVLIFLITTGLNKSFCEVVKLCELVLTISTTSVSVERSFTALKRIKNLTQNLTSEDRLFNLALISIKKQLVKQLSENSKILRRCYGQICSHLG